MNERQCVPAPESLLIGCMQTYLWRDERSGRCYFRLETRQEMPMKEMIRDSYVKNNLDNKEIRWNVINCDATQAGITRFLRKELQFKGIWIRFPWIPCRMVLPMTS